MKLRPGMTVRTRQATLTDVAQLKGRWTGKVSALHEGTGDTHRDPCVGARWPFKLHEIEEVIGPPAEYPLLWTDEDFVEIRRQLNGSANFNADCVGLITDNLKGLATRLVANFPHAGIRSVDRLYRPKDRELRAWNTDRGLNREISACLLRAILVLRPHDGADLLICDEVYVCQNIIGILKNPN